MASFMERRAQYRAKQEEQKKNMIPQIEAGTHTVEVTYAFLNKKDERKNDHPTFTITVIKRDSDDNIVGRITNNFDLIDREGNIDEHITEMLYNALDDRLEEVYVNSTMENDKYVTPGFTINGVEIDQTQIDRLNDLMDICSGINNIHMNNRESPKIDVLIREGKSFDKETVRNNIALYGYRMSDGIRPAGSFAKDRAKVEALSEQYHLKDLKNEEFRVRVMQKL